MPRNCTTDPITQCVDCPELDPTPGTPSYVERTPIPGWNAGANSIRVLDGDLHVVFSVPEAAGIVIGFKPDRVRQIVPELISFGLYFQAAGGQRYVRVVEYGVPRTPARPYAPEDVFEIRRRRGAVTYHHGSTRLYTSGFTSGGMLLVNACLYLSGDTIA